MRQDPTEKLEELRRHSLVLSQSDLRLPAGKRIPNRVMPDHAEAAKAESKKVGFALDSPTQDVASPQPFRAGKVQFGAVDFAKEPSESGHQQVLSPTEE